MNQKKIGHKFSSGIVYGLLLIMLFSNAVSAAYIFDKNATDVTATWVSIPNPRNVSISPNSTATLMVVNIYTNSTIARTGGDPTFNDKTMTQVGTRQQGGTGAEGAVEMWYLLLDLSDTGSVHNVSVPNTGGRQMRVHVATFISGTGLSALDNFTQKSHSGTTQANPFNIVTSTADGDVIIDALYNGGTSPPTANNKTLITKQDGGSYSSNSQYFIQTNAAAVNLSWTAAADDWGIITAAFKEVESTSTYIPPTPTINNIFQGNFWINYTWLQGSGFFTDSYNFSVNGGSWSNGTTTNYSNTTVGAHGWSNISVYAFNNSGSGNLNSTPAALNTQLANNIPVQTLAENYAITAGNMLIFTVSATDADSDPLIFSTNATGGILNQSTGVYSWMPSSADTGSYFWFFRSNDSYSGIATNTTMITVSDTSGTYINGTVRSGVNAVEGVRVSTNTSINTTTDAYGFYSLPVTAEAYELTAAKEPVYYTNSSVVVTAISGAVVVQDIELLIKPTGNITGSVTNV